MATLGSSIRDRLGEEPTAAFTGKPPTSGPRATVGPGSPVIPSLDGIRALAVTLVFLLHAGVAWSPGPFGVTIFFFLSGFLITTLLRVEFARTGTISIRAFYLRRALRLLPPLYLILGLACVLTLAGVLAEQKLRLTAVLAQFLYLSNYQILHSGWDGPRSGRPLGTGDLWSLAVEEHFYLFFPVLYLALCRYLPSPRRQSLVLAGICALVLAWRLVLILALHAPFDRTYAATDTRIDSILFGCILAVAANPYLEAAASPVGQGFWRRHRAALLAPVALAVIVASLAVRDPRLAGTFQYSVQGLALMPLFTVAIRYGGAGIFRLLNLRAVRLVGTMSYSIYLLQQIVITNLHQWLRAPHLVKGAAYLVVTLALATAVYLLVEKPSARLRRRLSRLGGGRGA